MAIAQSERPKQRKLTARVFTPSGWLLATFHVLEESHFLDYLNATTDFFTLTDVKLPGQSRALPFLALQKSAATLVVPGADELPDPDPPEGARSEQVSCLFEGGLLMGSLTVPPDQRLSDHLMVGSRFITLRACTIGLDSAGQKPSVEASRVVIVNTARVIGVAEM